jgi:hypothetical protein
LLRDLVAFGEVFGLILVRHCYTCSGKKVLVVCSENFTLKVG